MTREDEILERLDRLERMLQPVAEKSRAMEELREELTPRVNEAVKALIVELSDIEADFQLEDVLHMMKRAARSVHNLDWTLEQLNSVVDLVNTAEPLLRTSVPHAISKLDELERKNVFAMAAAELRAVQGFAERQSEEDIARLEEGIGRLLGVTDKLMQPGALDFLEHMAGLPGRVDLSQVREAGLLDMLGALRDKKVRRGLGVLLELARAMGVEEK